MSKNDKPWNELTWNEKKDRFKIFTFIFLFLSIFTFFSVNHPNLNELENINIKLTEEPAFKSSKGKSTSYWIELYSNEGKYEISGIDYKYISKEKFLKLIHKDTTITISKFGENIYKLKVNNEELLDYNLAGFHKTKNKNFMRIIFFSGFILCLVPFFFKNPPKLNNTELSIVKLIAISWIISIIIAIIYLDDMKYISSSEPFIQ
ncbi:hypothetical protein GFJ94_01855 [Flavobacterium sp. LMO8]|jgi:hypothetical protein|uniref:hypothetical protein n=1 Tax=Flavobacterium TaxID=237 RepID=UPI0004796DCF|nr:MULTISPECIES: hypothetical protein [Flavobacterium]MQP23804.1 hypothetical protein [Flavobacterium sp. LMO8]